jgi:purine-binding chemotaxis protein CheW
MVVVVRVAGEPVSLLVDSIGDVVEVDECDFEPPPDTLTDESRELVLGAYKLPDRLLLALDADRAVEL